MESTQGFVETSKPAKQADQRGGERNAIHQLGALPLDCETSRLQKCESERLREREREALDEKKIGASNSRS